MGEVNYVSIRIETKTHQIVLLQNLHVNNVFLPNILKNHGEILAHVEENRVTHLDATSWISRQRSISRHTFLVLNRVRFFIDRICTLTMHFFPTYSKIKLKYLPMVKKTVSHILTLLVTRLVETRSGNHQPVWLRSVSAPMPTSTQSLAQLHPAPPNRPKPRIIFFSWAPVNPPKRSLNFEWGSN